MGYFYNSLQVRFSFDARQKKVWRKSHCSLDRRSADSQQWTREGGGNCHNIDPRAPREGGGSYNQDIPDLIR